MDGLFFELIAYVLIVPLRILGLLGGSRGRAWARRCEQRLLREAWAIGATGATHNIEASADSVAAAYSLAATEYQRQAELELERNSTDLGRGQRRVESGSAGMSRSEQIREAMLEAQQSRQTQELRKREQRSQRRWE